MLIDQTRKSILSLSLVQIAAQQHKISLEMATMQEMRRELDVMTQSSFAQTIADDLHSSSVPDCPPEDHHAVD
ncbi:hypothetical protein [Nitrobacter sp. TKz-YC01]|uniref:hypothetical protein n=1 Tax=Nitrobacter sp. TKz-YC01 TaxID=3398703 RepID=UPI003A102240